MGSPLIWNGSFAKNLAQSIQLQTDIYILKGAADPTVVAQSAPINSLYFRIGTAGWYQKQDNGLSNNWTLISASTSVGIANVQEIPAGVVNGINDTFTLSQPAVSAANVHVYIDGMIINGSQWSWFSPSTIVFNAGSIPALGQQVYTDYFSTAALPALLTEGVEYHTLSGAEVAAKQLTLAIAPFSAVKTMVDLVGITTQVYATDYTVAGNILQWNGLGMDGLVVAGDVLRIHYFD